MTAMTIATDNTPSSDGSYDAGYFDGELDAIAKAPSRLVHARASMADAYDPIWAQGYADGYLNQIQVTYALAELGQHTAGN